MLRPLLLIGLCLSSLLASAQIAYVNLDAVLQLMPEVETMQQELRIYDQKQTRRLQPLADSLEAGRQQLQARQQAGEAREALQAYADSLETMRQRYLRLKETAEQGLRVRQTLFEQEINAKLDRHLQALAEEEGYRYIFNAQAQGSSVLLRSPDGVNLTRDLLRHMQVPLDELTQGQ